MLCFNCINMKGFIALLLTAVLCSCNASAIEDLEKTLIDIIGGQVTPIINHPFQVSISVDNQFVCSGSLIHPSWVLTVASCVKGYDPFYMKVRAGSPKTDSDGIVVGVRRIISHEGFTDHNMDNDIALIHLEKEFKQQAKIRTIRLANDPVTVADQVTVTGWGVDVENSQGSLMKLGMKIRDLESCKEELVDEVITPRMTCAFTASKSGPCWGDFGDPMVNKWHALVGIYSFTKQCNRYPSIFTDVVSFKPWIKQQLNQEGHDIE